MISRARGRVAAVTFSVAMVAACGTGGADTSVLAAVSGAAAAVTTTTTSTTTSTTTTSTTTSTTTTSTTTTSTTTTAPPVRFTAAPYNGLGAWVDAYDWSDAFSDAPISFADIDVMAAEGVQTIYIQTNRFNHPSDTLEPDRLHPLIDRAHEHGMDVVGWYLPTMVDTAADLRRLLAIADLDVDGIAVDIESLEVDDVAVRNQRLVELSRQLRAALPGETIGAIVLPPVVLDDVNPDFWPGFPWAELAPFYDVWLPMAYWTNRSGAWRPADVYMAANIAGVRNHIGRADAPVHAIGGIGDETTVADIEGMAGAAADHGAIGASIYDYATTKPEHWAALRTFRR